MRVIVALFGSSLLVASIAAIGACSSDSSSGDVPTTTGVDASAPKDSGGTTPTDSGSTPPPPGDAGADCGKPAQLFVSQDGGFLCPFSAVGAGGKDQYCTAAQECCETPKNTSPSTCQMKGAPCPVPGSVQWECEGPENCGANQVCCAHGGDGGAVSVLSDHCGPYLSKFAGTMCRAQCAAGELVVCQKQADCTQGTCTAVKPKGIDIGVCH